MVENPPANARDLRHIQSLGQEDPLEKGMATHSSILALENPMDSGAWRTLVHGVAKSRTRPNNLACTHVQNRAETAMKEMHAYKVLWEQR